MKLEEEQDKSKSSRWEGIVNTNTTKLAFPILQDGG
jgi:hypothetical protein